FGERARTIYHERWTVSLAMFVHSVMVVLGLVMQDSDRGYVSWVSASSWAGGAIASVNAVSIVQKVAFAPADFLVVMNLANTLYDMTTVDSFRSVPAVGAHSRHNVCCSGSHVDQVFFTALYDHFRGKGRAPSARTDLVLVYHYLTNPLVVVILPSRPAWPGTRERDEGREITLDDLGDEGKDAIVSAASLINGGFETTVLPQAPKVCTKGLEVDTAALEAVAGKMAGAMIVRGGHFLFGQTSRCENGTGFFTALHNLTGPNDEACPLRLGEKFNIFCAGAEYEATVIAVPPKVSFGKTGISDAGVFLAFSKEARYQDSGPLKAFPDRGRYTGLAQRAVTATCTKGQMSAGAHSVMYKIDAYGVTRRGASGSPGFIAPLLDGSVSVHTAHVGHEGGGLLAVALGGGEGPNVVLKPCGTTSRALGRLVDNLTVGEPSLLESYIAGKPRLDSERKKAFKLFIEDFALRIGFQRGGPARRAFCTDQRKGGQIEEFLGDNNPRHAECRNRDQQVLREMAERVRDDGTDDFQDVDWCKVLGVAALTIMGGLAVGAIASLIAKENRKRRDDD
ncbi:unnamed protein product, partial [Symbiodinium microadriaticum]